jgi:hypothetical protein
MENGLSEAKSSILDEAKNYQFLSDNLNSILCDPVPLSPCIIS